MAESPRPILQVALTHFVPCFLLGVATMLLLVFQCLVSYFMFALMVGIITRGVTRARDEIENA